MKSEKTILYTIGMGLFIIAILLIIWYASGVFLLAFTSILLAILLSSVSSWISKKTKIPYWLALALVILAFFVIATLVFWLSAPTISEQVKDLMVQIPKAYEQLKIHAAAYIEWWEYIREKIATNEKIIAQVTTIFSVTFGTITSFIIFWFVGIYLAASPKLYVDGFLKLFPQDKKKKAAKVLHKMGHVLQWWLWGKFISMAFVGFLTYISLLILKVPLAFILGILAGVLTFIPYIGSIIAFIPAVLIAVSQFPLKGVYVALVYLLIHGIETYLISPVITQKTIFLPPALNIMTQVLLTVLLGFVGLALATPLTVVALVLIEELYYKRIRKPAYAFQK